MKKPHYAWIVLGITFVVLLTSAAIRATPGVMIVPLEKEFGWSRAIISVAISVNLLLYGLIGPFAAGLVNRLPWQASWPIMNRLPAATPATTPSPARSGVDAA